MQSDKAKILLLITTFLFNAIDRFHAYVTEAMLIYLVVLVSQSVLLLVLLLCNSNNTELTRPEGIDAYLGLSVEFAVFLLFCVLLIG